MQEKKKKEVKLRVELCFRKTPFVLSFFGFFFLKISEVNEKRIKTRGKFLVSFLKVMRITTPPPKRQRPSTNAMQINVEARRHKIFNKNNVVMTCSHAMLVVSLSLGSSRGLLYFCYLFLFYSVRICHFYYFFFYSARSRFTSTQPDTLITPSRYFNDS